MNSVTFLVSEQQHARSALEIDPKDPECMNLYGCVLSQMGKDSEASLMYRRGS